MGAHDLPADFARAEAMAAAMFAEFFRPPANQTVSQWADANRMLSGKSSSEPGPLAHRPHALPAPDHG